MLLGVSKAAAVLVCLSGMNGSTLWSSPLPEEARDITCLNLMPGSVAETICLVTGTHRMFSAFNATSGKGHSTEVSVPGIRMVLYGRDLSLLAWWKVCFGSFGR